MKLSRREKKLLNNIPSGVAGTYVDQKFLDPNTLETMKMLQDKGLVVGEYQYVSAMDFGIGGPKASWDLVLMWRMATPEETIRWKTRKN
jgi:hypothetical protein